MKLNTELSNKLYSYLSGTLPLSDFRDWMMQLRVRSLGALEPLDKTFLYAFETRYAQLTAKAIEEHQFKQLLAYSAATEATTSKPQSDMWFVPKPEESQKAVVGTPTANATGTYGTYAPYELEVVA